MNDRLVTALGALIALGLVIGMFVQTPEPPPAPAPTSAEASGNGYLGLASWLAAADVPMQSLRLRYDSLADRDDLTDTGNVLLTTPPYTKPARADELQALNRWVSQGNTLVIAAALNDTPDWSDNGDAGNFLLQLQIQSGATFEAVADLEGNPLLVGAPGQQLDVRFLGEAYSSHPLAQGVRDLVAVTDDVASIWVPAEGSAGIPFLQEASSGRPAAWARERGRGHVITLAAGSLFSNRAIGREDNRRLLANILRWHLGPGGTFLFDDVHHGLSEIYDPEAFYSDARLGFTLLFVLAFWFAYMVGSSNRLLPPRKPRNVPRQGDLIRSMGGFLARKLPAGGAAGLIFERWFEALAGRAGSRDQGAVWAYLDASPLVSRTALAELRALHTKFEAGDKVDVRRLHNLIMGITEALG